MALRGILDADDVDAPDLLIGSEHRRNPIGAVIMQFELPRQLDCVVDRQLGSRSNREMCCMGRVALEDDMRVPIDVAPTAANKALEVEPRRAT